MNGPDTTGEPSFGLGAERPLGPVAEGQTYPQAHADYSRDGYRAAPDIWASGLDEGHQQSRKTWPLEFLSSRNPLPTVQIAL